MTLSKRRFGMVRERGEGAAEVKPVELFFDLVYVLVVYDGTADNSNRQASPSPGSTLHS